MDELKLFKRGEPEIGPPCFPARKFSEFTNILCTTLEKRPDINAVYQAKILLQDRFHMWRESVPKAHRYHMSETGHKCLWHCYEEAYHRIRIVELSLTPNLYAPEPETKIINGRIILGEK